jgi:hypothetical protein
MRFLLIAIISAPALLGLASGCDDASGSGCDELECDDECQADGWLGGVCRDDGSCECVGGDGDADSDSDSDTDTDSDSDSDSDGWTYTPGTQAAYDRTEPCDSNSDVTPAYAPQDGTTPRFCFPVYEIWAPMECGNNPWDLPGDCDQGGCASSVCMAGETGKWIGDGGGAGVCACFNLCTDQSDGASCGASGERACIPIDNAEATQVFICGGL